MLKRTGTSLLVRSFRVGISKGGKHVLLCVLLPTLLLAACSPAPSPAPATAPASLPAPVSSDTPAKSPSSGETLSPTADLTIPTISAQVSPTPESSNPPITNQVISPTSELPNSPTSEGLAKTGSEQQNQSLHGIPAPLMGVEINSYTEATPSLLGQAGVKLVRLNALLWSDVEPVEGQRNWDAIGNFENELRELGRQGYVTILIVRSTPAWAQAQPGYSCGPVKSEKLPAFASFLRDAVARYSQPPYNVQFWELGNEPDVDPSLVPGDSPFGCWGNQQDEYYGGGAYAEMLKAAYPAIKMADADAQVMIGGLLLDCDPTHPPEGKDCLPGKFLEGILKNGGGQFFDIVSFHGYMPYIGKTSLNEASPSWSQRGGVVLGKASFIREVLSAFGLQKPLFLTEASLLCPEWSTKYCDPPGSEFFESQADYAVILFVHNWAAGISGTVWFTFEGPGWRYGSMLSDEKSPKPAFSAFSFLSKELAGASYVAPVDQFPSIRGYEFAKPGKRVWVLWATGDHPETIQLPPEANAAIDKYGNSIEIPNGELTVGSPVYVELGQ